MVYVPELDRQGFADRQSKNRRPRPSINYTRRDDVRDLMKSPAGQNYSRMMDLQNQAIRKGGFEKGDPKVAELKAARRKYNREDKYNVGSLMGYNDPVEIQNIYRKNSGVLREYGRPTYKEMYPISDAFHEVTGSGGLTGLLLSKAIGKSKKAGKNFFDDLRGMGADILGGIGIGGAVDPEEATEEILTNYADKTFGDAYPTNIHDDEFIDTENWTERENVVIPPDYPIDEGAFTSLHPFDDSRREAAIMNQYAGKTTDPLGRPNIHEDEPWTYEDTEVIDKPLPVISNELWDSISDFDLDTIEGGGKIHGGEDITVAPWLLDPSLPMPEELTEGEYLPGEYHDELISPADDYDKLPSLPPAYDDSAREAGIMQNMSPYSRNYVPPLKFPPIGPHDPFNPDQQVFENDEEYRAWLRRKRLGY